MTRKDKQITKYDLSKFNYADLKQMDNATLQALSNSIRDD